MSSQLNSTGYKTFADWFSVNVEDDECEDLCHHGIANFAIPRGLNHHWETAPFYDEFSEEIWDFVLQDGITIQEHIAEQDFCGSATSFASFMVWSAAERLAFERIPVVV